LKDHHQPLEALKAVEEQVEELEVKVEKPVERRVPDVVQPSGPIRLGAKVALRTLGNQGIVTALGEEDAEVQIGVLRIRARLGELMLVGESDSTPEAAPRVREKPPLTTIQTNHPSPGIELDLRGQRAEDALDKLSSYIEQAFLARLPWVRVIHGKGTGRLRQVVRDALKGHPQVRKFEAGGNSDGGDGVTVIHFDS
ncbi:MAG: Smr/MutS family protein, partial [Chloroflexota bacterium]